MIKLIKAKLKIFNLIRLKNIAEIFNQHFSSVAVVLKRNLGHCIQDPLNYLFNRIAPSFFLLLLHQVNDKQLNN